MKSRHLVTTLAALCTALALLASGTPAQAGLFNNLPQVLFLQPGQDQTRQFYLDDAINLDGLGNRQSFLFFALADNSSSPAIKCGVLTVTLSTSATITFGSTIAYSLTGFSYAEGATPGVNSFFSANFTTPQKATKAIALNAMYGVGYVTSFIRQIDGVVTQPTPMTIVFSLAAKK